MKNQAKQIKRGKKNCGVVVVNDFTNTDAVKSVREHHPRGSSSLAAKKKKKTPLPNVPNAYLANMGAPNAIQIVHRLHQAPHLIVWERPHLALLLLHHQQR